MIDRVSDERLDVLVQQRAHDEEWYQTELQTLYLLRELQEWRSGKRKRWQDEVTCIISADSSGLDDALASAAEALGRAAEREQAAPKVTLTETAEREQAEPRADHDVDRFYLENTDYRIEDIVALDDTGYNWNLIHGIGLCGTTRTPFEGWRCILSAGGLSMAGYEGMTMHEAISAALSALDQGREAEAQPAPVVPEKPTWEEAVKRMDAEREQAEQAALDAASDEALANMDAQIAGAWPNSDATACAPHGETYGEACCRFTKEVDEMRRKVAEALGVCEEAAPTEPRLAKWERRLDKMSGGLHFNYSGGEGWYASWMIDGGVVKYAYGDTPKAAVKAAWKAWREARDEH